MRAIFARLTPLGSVTRVGAGCPVRAAYARAGDARPEPSQLLNVVLASAPQGSAEWSEASTAREAISEGDPGATRKLPA